jgi:UDP-glucose 4-epimerase
MALMRSLSNAINSHSCHPCDPERSFNSIKVDYPKSGYNDEHKIVPKENLSMRALVTGGAGFIGSNLVEALVDEYEVTILDNFHTGSMKNLQGLKKKIQVINGSCTECLSFDLNPDIIFHLGIPSSSAMYKSNPFLVGEAINGTIAMMELARQKGCRKVVFASSSSLYNGINTPHREDAVIQVTDYYTEARLAIERIVELYHRLHDIDYAGLRFFSVYGPHEEAKGNYANMVTQFFWEMKSGKTPVIFGEGTQTRDFIYVKDIVDALILASKKGTGLFNAGTGISHSFNDVIELLAANLGIDSKVIYRVNPIENYVMHTKADITKMAALGFMAKYSLDQGIDLITRN